MSNILSYHNIINDIKNFKSSGTYWGNDFNIYDTPSQKYFKLLFYFGSQPEFDTTSSSGFLAPTWEYYTDDNKTNDYYNHNSAWAYLKLNGEEERAEKLRHFITLLSDINSHSPWYFTSLNGVSEALERKSVEEGKIEISDKKLTISCLPDAFDNRISTLLELYRDVTWSWVHKKEIIPANLRKFDMAVYIFESPEYNWHKDEDVIGNFDKTKFNVSYKMIEFHDCEINYNSIKSAWSELNNQTGMSPTYQIEITYSDCYEISYNDIMMRKIGDVILSDLINANGGEDNPYSKFDDVMKAQENYQVQIDELAIRTKPYEKGFLENAISQAAGHLTSDVNSVINRVVLGNIYGLSLSKVKDQLEDFAQGNLIKTGMTVAQYARQIHNTIKDNSNIKPEGNIFDTRTSTINQIKSSLGNIFNDKTIAKNL